MSNSDKFKEVLEGCDGEKETVAVIYCDNKEETCQFGFIGNEENLSAAISKVFERLANEKGSEAEMAIASAILFAIAATDLVYNGAVLKTIREHQKPIMEDYNKIKGRGEA